MMNTDGMLCALKSDLFKLKKHKSVWIGLAVMFVIMLLAYCVYWIGMDFLDALIAPDNPESSMIKNEIAYAFLANFSGTSALTLMVAIITCLFIGKDFSNGVTRLSVSRGANRVQLFFSKWLSLALLTVIYSVFAIIICGIFASFKSVGVPFTSHLFGLLMRCFALQILCNLSTMSIVLMIAFLFRSSGASLGAMIGIFFAISLIAGLIQSLSAFNNIDWILFMPLQQSDIAGSMSQYSTTELCAVIIMPIVYGALSIAIGLITFLKRDIK